jgi:hypothetical protein
MADINMTKTDFFSTTRITRLVQTLANELEVSQPLTFLNRTPIVPVLDDIDILGSYSGPIFAADLITEDAEAVVVEGGRMEINATVATIPKIKIGQRVSESIIRRLTQLQQGVQLAGDTSVITGWELDFADTLVRSVRQRMNALCAAMMLDNHTYDRLGVKLSGTFGAPSALKLTLAGADKWIPANAATMTPVDDLQMLVQTASVDYGKNFNRVTMSTLAFNRITASAEFAERVRLARGLEPSMFSLSPYDTANLKNLFTQVTGLQLELEDNTMRVRNANGSQTQSRYLPANQVLLSDSNDDGNRAAFDFANGIVTESIVAPMIAGAPDFGGEQVGPVAFYNGNRELNPPDLRCWAVARGFPRKHDKNATAVITVAATEALTS